MASSSRLSQYPPEEHHLRWGAFGSLGVHVLIVGGVLLLAFLTHVKSLEELMRESGSIATNGPAPEEPMEVLLQPVTPPPPPTDHVEFIKQIEQPKPKVIPPPPTPVKVQKVVPRVKPRYTAPKATGTGETNTISKLVVGSGNFPAPQYPYSARLRNESGTVLVTVIFDGAGSAEDVEVVQSSGFSDLDANARNSIRRTWHDPAFANRSATVPIEYTLN